MMEARVEEEDTSSSNVKPTPENNKNNEKKDEVKVKVNQPSGEPSRGAMPGAKAAAPSEGKPKQSKVVKGQSELLARAEEDGNASLVDKAVTGDDDWEKRVPHVSLLSPLKELDLKLRHQQKESKKIEKETQKKIQDMSDDTRSSITSYFQKRKYLVTMLKDLSPDSVDWDCPAVSVAKARMEELDKSIAQVEEGMSEVLTLSKSLDGKLQGGEITYKWLDVSQETGSNEISFDVLNILQCVSLWYMSNAFKISSGRLEEYTHFESLDKKGVSLPFARFSSGLLRKAAGLQQYAIKVCEQVKLFGDGHLQDCSPKSLALLRAICISDSQSIVVASAIEGKRSPSLIASLSFSCEDELHKEILKKGEKGAGGGAHDKWIKYAEYKMGIAKALGYSHQALSLLEEEEGGKARRCSQEALELLQMGIDLSQAYCNAKPKTSSQIYRLFHEELKRLISNIDRRTERENAIVHMKAIPLELPLPLAKKHITSSIDPSNLPSSDGYQVAKEEIQDSENDRGSASCLKWLATWVAFPLLLLISFIGCIVWIVLLPFKLVCCPCGALLQSAWNVMEMMLKAPLHAIQWAAGTTDSKNKEETKTKVEV